MIAYVYPTESSVVVYVYGPSGESTFTVLSGFSLYGMDYAWWFALPNGTLVGINEGDSP